MTMLEKVATAIIADMKRQAESKAREHAGNSMVDPSHFGDGPLVVTVDHTLRVDEVARAALMAMRSGSGAIDSAVARAAWHSGSGQAPGNVWCAGVDAALADAPPCPPAPGSVE